MNKQIEKKENIAFIIFLRILAAFSVVMLHTKSLTSYGTKGYHYLDCCISWGVPTFFMITGYIFLGIKKNVTYAHVKKNIVKFLVTLFTVGWFYALIQRIFENGISISGFIYSFIDVVKGDSWSHMWYVYSIIGIYLILPLLSAFVSDNKKNLYILTLICGIYNIVFADVSTFFEIGFHFPMSGYCFYVLMGGVLHTIEEKYLKKMFIPSVTMLILTIAGLALAFFVFNINIKQSHFTLYIAIMSVSIFIICNRIFNKKASSFIVSISKCTWGIYLVHPFFIHLIHKLFNVTLVGYNQLVAFPVACLIIFMISYFAVLILKRISLINKII